MACRARLAPTVPAALARDAEPRLRLVADAAATRRAAPRASSPSGGAPASASPPTPPTPSHVRRRGALLGAALSLGLGAPTAARSPARAAATPITDEAFAELEMRARTAYRAKRLDEAYALLTELHELEPENGQWLERRAQCLVDLKRFSDAIRDFDAAVALYEPEYRSLGLLSNRALAYEGLSDFNGALRDYDEVVRLSSAIDRAPPYVLNSRGNVLCSLGRYEEALESYRLATETFQRSRNLSGAIYARSNAALMLAELGREDEAIAEFEAVARRAAGSIDGAPRWRRCGGAAGKSKRRRRRGTGRARRSTPGFDGGRARAGRVRAVPRRGLAAPRAAVAAEHGGQADAIREIAVTPPFCRNRRATSTTLYVFVAGVEIR